MAYQIKEKIGDGGYGNVYKGRDDNLERDVAIKFIHTAAGNEDFTKDQAKALSRCNSENVVTVYSLEELEEPDVGATKPALVMELLRGETVLSHVTKGNLSLDDVRRIGLGTINGLDNIHSACMIHGDLSLGTVMASADSVKIIDILYKHTLAGADSQSRDQLRLDDRNSLRDLLTKLIRSVMPSQADAFTKSLSPESSIADIRVAFEAATDPKLIINIPTEVTSGRRRRDSASRPSN
jgi:serine/threonine protein kinase